METYLVSRTDSIGDVILTLPVCGYLKALRPGCRIIFLCRRYTQAVVACCAHVDEILIWDDLCTQPLDEQVKTLKEKNIHTIYHVFPVQDIAALAKKAGIPNRVGTSHRWWHWVTANKRVSFSRRRSNLHEAQLNLKLLQDILGKGDMPLADVAKHTGFTKIPALDEKFSALLNVDKCNIILHPKSQGSAREWPPEKFAKLTQILPVNRFRFLISGTEKEKPFADALEKMCTGDVLNIAGKMPLQQFIALIARADFLVANSTGPLHIAAATGIGAIGLYPPMRPIDPGRWAPLGPHVQVFCLDKQCNDCRKGGACACIQNIDAVAIADYIQRVTG